MRKLILTVLAALLAGGIVSAQSNFPDIPAGHWAGDAVSEIADYGIVIGFPDGTFRGNEAFTRYQAALVVSRLLAVVDAHMEAGLGTLRASMQEMAADLAAQGVRLAAAESAIASTSDMVMAHDAAFAALAADVEANGMTIAGVAADLAALSATVDAMAAAIGDHSAAVAADLAALADRVSANSDMLAAHDEAVAAMAAALGDHSAAVAADLAALADRISAAEAAISANSDTLAAHDAAVAAIAADVAALSGVVAGLGSDLDGVAGNVAALSDMVAGLGSDLDGVAGNIEAMSSAVAAMGSRLESVDGTVAAMGSRLGAVESAVAGLSDNLAANAARLDALEAAMAAMPEGVDEAVLRDLTNQIASQRVAIDTAQAQAEAAEARAGGAYDLALQALAAADANAADIGALNAALQLLSGRVDALAVPAPAPGCGCDLSGIARNAGDISNVRDFLILMRRDQVGLRDRVTALEAADAEITASIDDLAARVTALETNPYGFTGSISVDYFVGRTLGAYDFDVDRVYGVNAAQGMGNSAFSTGAKDGPDAGTAAGNSVGERAQDRADITQTTGAVGSGLSSTMTFKYVADGAGSPRALNAFSAVATLELVEGPNNEWGVFRVTKFTTTFNPIGAAPLVFAFGSEVSASFTNYVFNADKLDGFVATVSAPDFLAFLNPGLWAAYFADNAGGYWRGVRGTMAPEFGDAIQLSGGVSFAQAAANADDKDDVLADNAVTTVWGLDGTAALLGIVELDFEYANSAPNSILYVVADVTADLPILTSLGGNYRAMAAAFDGIGGAGDDPFELGQSGFGVEAGLSLFILDVTGFYDSYTHEASTDANAGYGVSVMADLFAGFSLTGFYESASVNGAVVDGTANVSDVEGYSLLDGNYATKFGVAIKHDGAADNALIAGLNIAAGYERWEADFSRTRMYANADYNLVVSILSISPYVSYESDVDADAGTNDFTEILAGVGVTTETLDIIFAPSLMAAANYRTTTYTDAAAFTATELQWSVGVTLGEFLLPNSELHARVGSWTGTNTTASLDGILDGDTASDISGQADANGTSESVFGYEAVWNYYDLEFAFGSYTSSRSFGGAASAQAFSISYTVDF